MPFAAHPRRLDPSDRRTVVGRSRPLGPTELLAGVTGQAWPLRRHYSADKQRAGPLISRIVLTLFHGALQVWELKEEIEHHPSLADF